MVPILWQRWWTVSRRVKPLSEWTEADVRDPVVRWFKANGGLHERNHKGKGAATGWPDDRFNFGQGHVYVVEFKRPVGGTISARQQYIVDLLKAAGHDVDFHNSPDEAIKALARRMETFGRAITSSRTPHP